MGTKDASTMARHCQADSFKLGKEYATDPTWPSDPYRALLMRHHYRLMPVDGPEFVRGWEMARSLQQQLQQFQGT